MKKVMIVAAAVVMMMGLAGSAMAANSLAQGSMGISVGMGESNFVHSLAALDNVNYSDVVDISGRYFVAKDVALYGGFGLQLSSGDYDGSYFSFTAGVRKYLSTNDFAPFIGGQFSYISVDADGPTGVGKIADATILDVAGLFGAEYFFSKNFSVEGAVGVGMGHLDNKLAAPVGGDSTYLGTRTVGVKASFYF